jgi:hypothetical protein
MTTVQRVAQIFGIGFLFVGIVGFFSSYTMHETGMMFGVFPVNIAHNVVHLLFGLWGLAAARSFGAARNYARIAGVIYLVLAVVGWVYPDGFGLVPLGGANVWLHLVLGVALAYFGFTSKEEAAVTS